MLKARIIYKQYRTHHGAAQLSASSTAAQQATATIGCADRPQRQRNGVEPQKIWPQRKRTTAAGLLAEILANRTRTHRDAAKIWFALARLVLWPQRLVVLQPGCHSRRVLQQPAHSTDYFGYRRMMHDTV